jgi:hypothetical protein
MFNSLAVRSMDGLDVLLALRAVFAILALGDFERKVRKKVRRGRKEKLASAMIVANAPANVRLRLEDNG